MFESINSNKLLNARLNWNVPWTCWKLKIYMEKEPSLWVVLLFGSYSLLLSLGACLTLFSFFSGLQKSPLFFFFKDLFTSYFLAAPPGGILIPWPGMKPMPLELDMESINYWTAREAPQVSSIIKQEHPIMSSHPLVSTCLCFCLLCLASFVPKPGQEFLSPLLWVLFTL